MQLRIITARRDFIIACIMRIIGVFHALQTTHVQHAFSATADAQKTRI